MQNKGRWIANVISLAFILIVLSGCISVRLKRTMALNEQNTGIDLSQESMVLLRVKASNQYRPTYQPNLKDIRFIKQGSRASKDMFRFIIGKPYKIGKHKFNEYLISASLPPGDYELLFMLGDSWGFPVVGIFALSVHSKFHLDSKEILYLGKLEATLLKKENKDGQFTGHQLPLIDQYITGYGWGTFKRKVVDNYEEDTHLFRQKFPALSNYDIKKMIIVPDR